MKGTLASGLLLAEGQEAPAKLGPCGGLHPQAAPNSHRPGPHGFTAPVGNRGTLWKPACCGSSAGCRSWRQTSTGLWGFPSYLWCDWTLGSHVNL